MRSISFVAFGCCGRAVCHRVDRLLVAIEDEGAVVAEIVVHPDAEIDVDPLHVEVDRGVDDGVVPDRDALLIVGNASKLALDDMLDQLRLSLERALVDAAAGPEEKADDQRQGDKQREDRRYKNSGGKPPSAGRAPSLGHYDPERPNKPARLGGQRLPERYRIGRFCGNLAVFLEQDFAILGEVGE